MMLPEAKPLLFSTFFCIVVVVYAYSEESCYRFRRKENVTIDPDQCLWENYTEPKTKRFCLESCFENETQIVLNLVSTIIMLLLSLMVLTCTVMCVTSEKINYTCKGNSDPERSGCFVEKIEKSANKIKHTIEPKPTNYPVVMLTFRDDILRDRKPGQQVLRNDGDITLSCQRGWAGRDCDSCDVNFEPVGECSRCSHGWTGGNCDTCAPNFGPAGQCDECLGGWTGDNCDSCADGWLLPKCDVICDGFGCCNNDNCQGCIQNGRWVTTFGDEVHLTFKGERCSDLVPGTEIAIYIISTLTNGNLNETNHSLTFTDSTFVYECTIAEDKSLNTTAWPLSSPNEQFRLTFSYVYPTAK